MTDEAVTRLPREEKFVLLDRHAACLKAGAVTLRELLNRTAGDGIVRHGDGPRE
jgi:hypothetical protein